MIDSTYKNVIRKKYTMLFGCVFLTLLLAYYFTTIGMDVPLSQTITAIYLYLSGELHNSADIVNNKIILLLRIPRILLSILAGVGLAISGAIMQSITRNYLVSPFTLGISSAAAFGASLCIVFGTGAFFQSDMAVILCAFVASCCCGLVVYGISQQLGVKPSTIVLVGIALNYLFSAMTATIEFFAKEHKLEAVVQWTFGSFNRATWSNVILTIVVVVVCLFFTWYFSLRLNAMASNDDETARSLGINPERIRTIGGLVAVFLTSTIISFTGVIGFVGLIAPHMARFIIGTDYRFYIPFTAVLGALLLLISDTVGKLILYPVNIPVGIVVSFLGVPLFVHLIMSKGREFE